MPIAAALAVRVIIQWGVMLALDALITRFGLPYINNGIAAIMTEFGVDEETAKDIMSNEIILFAERLGIGALLLRSRLPLIGNA
jgi:hypothetical protein